jgi:hypothetical protein
MTAHLRCTQWLLALVLVAALVGCGAREEVPLVAADSTIVYPPRRAGDPTASITLCTTVSRKTGRPLGAGREFELREGGKVRAFVEFDRAGTGTERPLFVHLVWLDPDGQCFYRKSFEHDPSSGEFLESAISISPGKRDPGRYAFQVYLFRELVAEKTFVLTGKPGETSRRRAREDATKGVAAD